MADMDQGIKRLVQMHTRDILLLAEPEADYLAPIATDVATEPQLMLDTLYRVRLHGEECAINIEAQAHPTLDMPRRCFEYGSRASIVHGLPVISVVLWLLPGKPPPTSPYSMRIGPREVCTWTFTGIEVYRLPARDMIRRSVPGILPLVPFMDGADLATVEEAARIAKESAPADQVVEIESLLAVFIARFHGKDAARAIIRRLFMSTEILEQSPLYREWIESAEVRGEARGMRDSVRMVLESRLGPLAADLAAAIEAADEAMLRAIIPLVATGTLEAVRVQLGLAPSPQT